MTTIFDILLNQHLESSKNQNCKRYQSHCLNNNNNCTIKNESKRSIDFLPTLDVYENNDSLIVQVELAGVDKQDIDVQIKDSILTIQGEKKLSSKSATAITTTPSSLASTLSTVNTTNSAVSPSSPPASTNESTDLPSIEEFEEGDPTIKKSNTEKSTSTPNIESSTPSPNTTHETIKKKYILERSSGHFKRYVDLTKILYSLDLSSISTDYTNGLLTITIKKKSNYTNTIKININ